MFVPDSLKLNHFEDVRIPTNIEYFGRVGKSVLASDNLYSEEPILPKNKVDSLADYEAYVEMMANEQKE